MTRSVTYAHNNIGRELLPVTIANQTKRNDLYFYVVGTTDPQNPEHHWHYLKSLDGTVAQCTPSNGEITYSIPLPKQQSISLHLPRLSGMRLYFSFEKPLQVTVGPNGIPSSPAGWLRDSNFGTLFDWIELTWEINSATDMTLGGNTTQVDMFGLPFALTLTGVDPQGTALTEQGGFHAAGTRNKILRALQDAPLPWSQLVVRNETTGFATRVVSPYHGMEMGLFPRTQLDDYINRVWKKYATETLTATAEGVQFEGKVSDDKFVFTARDHDHHDGHDGESIVFTRPDTFTVYTSGPSPMKASPKAGVLQAALQAGFMRSTLLVGSVLPCCDSALYYQSEPINLYAKTFHEYGSDGGAYAFGFDDVCSKSSFIIVHNPESAQLTLLEF